MATLELVRRDRKGGAKKTARSFLDFTIDGDSLYARLGEPLDLISPLWLDHPAPDEKEKAIQRLLKQATGDLHSDRVSLYICPECGDLGCGAISAEIIFSENAVVWSDFGYENNYEDAVARERYESIGPFEFDRVAYETAFKHIK